MRRAHGSRRLRSFAFANGIQIFPGGVPIYRGSALRRRDRRLRRRRRPGRHDRVPRPRQRGDARSATGSATRRRRCAPTRSTPHGHAPALRAVPAVAVHRFERAECLRGHVARPLAALAASRAVGRRTGAAAASSPAQRESSRGRAGPERAAALRSAAARSLAGAAARAALLPRESLPGARPLADHAGRSAFRRPWFDPYNQNVLKGDQPGRIGDWFVNLGVVSDTLVRGAPAADAGRPADHRSGPAASTCSARGKQSHARRDAHRLARR